MKRLAGTFTLIFILALSFRLAGSLLNREANDDHMEAISLIVDSGHLPDIADCAECFQPKFFYVVCAVVIKLFHADSAVARVVTVQLFNFLLSLLLLWYVLRFIRQLAIPIRLQHAIFALVAFNPCLVGINMQATNDTMMILAGTMIIWHLGKWHTARKKSDALYLIILLVLAPLIKGSGLVFFVVTVCYLTSLLLWDASARNAYKSLLLTLIVVWLVVVPVAGGYYSSYERFGTPFSTGIGAKANYQDDKPFTWRPGIQSVAGGYMTFRLFDMLKQPYITNDPDTFPLHRTSVWSQLYGRTVFMHFDQHPPSWQNTQPFTINIGRIAIILGLLPLIILIGGGMLMLYHWIIGNRFNLSGMVKSPDWYHLLIAGAFLAFIVYYTRYYPDFSTMKSLFLFPGLLSFIWLFSYGLRHIKREYTVKWVAFGLWALVVIHLIDLNILIKQLL